MFDPIRLRSGFVRLLRKSKYRKRIDKDVNDFLRNKRRLVNDPNYVDAIRKVGVLIASINWFRNKPAEDFKKQFDVKISHKDSNFLRSEKDGEN